MGLWTSKLPQKGRVLRPQEKGNVAGVAGSLGGRKEAVKGMREVQVPHTPSPVCTRPPPQPVIGTQLCMLEGRPCFDPLAHLLCGALGTPR